MRLPWLLRPLPCRRTSLTPATARWSFPTLTLSHSCSCSAPLALAVTKPLNANPNHARGSRKKVGDESVEEPAPDHRDIGTAQSLFTTHLSSPGAPFFQPDGTHIFQKLISFLRAQYLYFGFREVLTPTMYKETLWRTSGHWDNYKDDMFMVIENSSPKLHGKASENCGDPLQPREPFEETSESEKYGLKPMNCPGHCLLYQSERRSYRDLPIRYAEFSPLHRNEISGALSGLTRVRRFHQDDGHIFCRPGQVKKEVKDSLTFMNMVYETLGLRDYRLVLSTRPEKNSIGKLEDWNRAEGQLKDALDDNLGKQWKTEEGEGAFYGPKIDIILRDNDGKEHQTGTIQLDLQLPKRFELAYESPAPDMEAEGEYWGQSEARTTLGSVVPVMIHRAIFGSLERFMALLLEKYNGRLPFWLSPNQVIILTVGDTQPIRAYANEVKNFISNEQGNKLPRTLNSSICCVDVDHGDDSISRKIVRAKKKKYNIICVVGQRNMSGEKATSSVDLDVSAQPDQRKTWEHIEGVKPGSRAPLQRDRGSGFKARGLPGVRLTLNEFRGFIKRLNINYC